MKESIKRTLYKGYEAVRSNPVELLIALICYVINILLFEKAIKQGESLYYYFPMLMILAYMLNKFADKTYIRWMYYGCVLLIIPLLWLQKPESEDFFFCVTMGVLTGVYLATEWQRENTPFMESFLQLLRSLLFAFVLSAISYVLLISLYFSIQYIFEIWKSGDSWFYHYSGYAVSMVVFPSLFIYFHYDKSDKIITNKLTDILLNYVLSPVLLIYTVILYLYFIKIAVMWSLPKGGVAAIVLAFSIALFFLKGCVLLVNKCSYKWLYDKASWIVFPAYIMFWIATLYRINQYGFTEERVYLLVSGLVISLTAILFLTNRTGRYLYVTLLAILLFGGVTYIPGIRALDIERISQSNRTPVATSTSKLPTSTDIHLLEAVSLEGYRSLNKVYDYKTSDGMYFNNEERSLDLYSDKGVMLYSLNLDSLLSVQMKKVGLTHSDSLPKSSYSALLKIELDSALLVLGNLNLRHDSVYKISDIAPEFYLKK